MLLAALWLTAGAALAAPHPGGKPAGRGANGTSRHQPIVIDAAYSYVDYKTNTVNFRDVVVSQGDTRVTAQKAHAAGVGFANSRWTFEGNVLMSLQPRGTLRSDQAIVEFHDNRVSQATALGKPAHFEQQRADSRPAVQGDADRIVYTAKDDAVRLSGDARLSDGRNVEISGPMLVYSIGEERLEAVSPGARRRVHITVNPGTLRKRGQAPAGKAPRR